MKLEGIFPPLVTPFDANGALDLAGFEANLDSYAGEGLGGYLVLGSNGEAASLDEAEKLELVRAARRRSAGRTLLVGTGLESTRGTIDFTRKAADAGADAALVLTPHYYKSQMTSDVLRRHYEAVADASPVPVLVYSVPAFTGLAFPPALAPTLAAHPNIRGMKESSGDVGLLGRIVASVPPSFAVACGNAPVLYPAVCVGAVAGVLAIACCAPRPTIALFEAARAGDHERARRLQAALAPLASAVTAGYGVAGLKAAMELLGRRGGHVRAPLRSLDAAAHEALRALVDTLAAAA